MIVFNSPSFFLFFFIPRLFLPSDFPSFLFFLILFLSSFTFHLFFPSSSVAPGWWWWWWGSYYSVLDTSSSSVTHTYRHFPDAQRQVVPRLRLMEKLHWLPFWTIVFTHTFLGQWYKSGGLAWGVGIAESAKGCRRGVGCRIIPSQCGTSQKSNLFPFLRYF